MGRTSASPAPEGAYVAYSDGRVSLSTGCNTGSAEIEVTDDTITFDVMEFENAVVQMLGETLEYTLEGDGLTLSNGESRLTLERIP